MFQVRQAHSIHFDTFWFKKLDKTRLTMMITALNENEANTQLLTNKLSRVTSISTHSKWGKNKTTCFPLER